MSFDLKLENNDISINPDGGIQTVRDNEKLKQDIIKAILTPLGSNPFHQWYGSTLSQRTIGQALDAGHTEAEARRAIQNTLTNLVALQKAQSRTQFVSPGETIASIQNILVLRDKTDPRQFQVIVSVLTKQLTAVEESFTLRV